MEGGQCKCGWRVLLPGRVCNENWRVKKELINLKILEFLL